MVSAGWGPVTRQPSAASAAIAGSISSISSRPSWPPSPACGLRPGYGEPRLGDAEIALQAAQAPRGRAIRSAPAVSARGTSRKRQVGGHRNGAQRRAGEHHHHVPGRNAAALGDELGLAGMLEADGVELLLGDRAGDDRRRGAGPGKADRELERVERAMRAGDAGMAGDGRRRRPKSGSAASA